jgi:hypothetical protein
MALSLLVVAVFLLWQSRGQTLYADEWAFFYRAAGLDLSRMLEPHQGNLVLTTVFVYKGTLALAGAEHHVALRLVWIALDLTCAALLFVMVRARVGSAAAFFAALPLSVFGAAWEFFGGSLGITVFLCVAAGLGALLALERRTRAAEAIACLLLAVSLSSLSTGLAFAVGAAVVLLIPPDRWRRIWIVAVPLLLYGGWSLWARKFDQSGIAVETLASAPAAMVDSLASASSALFGAFRSPPSLESLGAGGNLVAFVNEEPGYLIGAVLIVAVVWRLGQAGFQRRMAPFFAMPLAYWLSLSIVTPARIPSTGRYQYAAAIFILLLFAELWRDYRPSPAAIAGMAALCLCAIVPNVANLHYGADFVREVGEQDRAKLAVVDELRDRVDAGTVVQPPPFSTAADMVIEAGDYLRAVDEFGSPGYSIDQLHEVGSTPKQGADREFVYLLGIQIEPSAHLAGRRCQVVPVGEIISGTGSKVPKGGFSFQAIGGAPVTIGLRRYSEDFYRFDPAPGGGPYLVRIPPDHVPQPWVVGFESSRPVRVCPLADV